MLEVVMLAAGKSQRFNGIKQCAQFHGKALLEHCLATFYQNDQLIAGISKLTVVIGANAQVVKKLHLGNANVLQVEGWANGMGASLAEFMQTIDPKTTHLLIALADQVAVNKTDIERLIAQSASHPNSIIVARYADVKGVPAIFSKRYFADLASLQGDKGAKSVIASHSDNVIGVTMPNALIDIDTQHDLIQLSNPVTKQLT